MQWFIWDTNDLVIYADEEDRSALAELKADNPEEFTSDKTTGDVLESMLSNSELRWICPDNTGDLTDAPMIGIIDHETRRDESGPFGSVLIGGDGDGPEFSAILGRWGFMSYQVTTIQEELLNCGVAVLIGSGTPELLKHLKSIREVPSAFATRHSSIVRVNNPADLCAGSADQAR